MSLEESWGKPCQGLELQMKRKQMVRSPRVKFPSWYDPCVHSVSLGCVARVPGLCSCLGDQGWWEGNRWQSSVPETFFAVHSHLADDLGCQWISFHIIQLPFKPLFFHCTSGWTSQFTGPLVIALCFSIYLYQYFVGIGKMCLQGLLRPPSWTEALKVLDRRNI